MKTFTKGTLTTTVDDDDRRIPDYLANGWKEAPNPKKPKDDADKRIDKAIGEANASEETPKSKGGGKGTKGKNSATDKKVNDAVDASKNAESEREAVDDGLIKGEAAKK